jgi:SPFH domain / Band 7 family
MRFIMKQILFVVLLISVSACTKMGPTEVGVRFRKLPPAVGGGLSSDIIERGETKFLFPWDSVYRFDTSIREIEWGYHGPNEQSDYVQTRAKDGNEVALSVRVQYSIGFEPKKIISMVQQVATNDREVENIVVSVGRSFIRTYMNELNTAQFFDNKEKFDAGERAKEAMQKKLEPWGILINSVNLGEHRFERVLKDGTLDASYQERINEVQTLDEKTKREKLRKATVEADKAREFNDKQAEVNRILAEANGYLNQAKLKGDGYFDSKTNEAKAILASGKAEVDGLIEQINALSGPGGEAILKLELVKNLISSNARFFIMGGAAGRDSLEVKKTDTNEILRQIGIFEGLKDDLRAEKPKKE